MQDHSQREDVVFVVVGRREVVIFWGAVRHREAGLVIYIRKELLLT